MAARLIGATAPESWPKARQPGRDPSPGRAAESDRRAPVPARGVRGQPVLERALIDYYRCPQEFVRLVLAGELSPDAGYFQFGPGTVCYGQTSSGSRAGAPVGGLFDALTAVRTEGGVVRVPFDPSQVIDNLRLERYATDPAGTDGFSPRSWQTAAYYGLRGLIPTGPPRSRH